MRDMETNRTSAEGQSTPAQRKHDRPLRSQMAQLFGGASPAATVSLISNWSLHLMSAPDKQLSLAQKAQSNWVDWMNFVAKGCPADPQERPIAPQHSDRRFNGEAWQRPPFSALSQAFLLAEDFTDHATTDVPGLSPAQEAAMAFLSRQMMDAFAPSNFLLTNPDALDQTVKHKGANLLKGFSAFMNDKQAQALGKKGETPLHVGQDVAVTKGKVVYRNHLMELIQYEPQTEKVHAEPLLIVPAWIMKYYIMDLSPENSLVRYLVEQGFTVFMISWRNPDVADAELGMADYLAMGPLAAIDHIKEATGSSRLHGAGYCLGGTLLSIAAAKLARDGDDSLRSMTLIAAQTDFQEAGELMLFIDESQVSVLEDVMQAQGYLEASQMASAFAMLRSNDLLWSRMIHAYLMGEDPAPMTDLMSWNMDTTRMPARMHSEYLRSMFLNNDLAAGRYAVDGHPVSLRDIRIPVFGVGTETDHIAPWKSVFKIHNLGHADVTFVLTNGGHNAGVISKPGHARRHYRQHTILDRDRTLTPEDWLNAATLKKGSWWPTWSAWLAEHSSGLQQAVPLDPALGDAPGAYVQMT